MSSLTTWTASPVLAFLLVGLTSNLLADEKKPAIPKGSEKAVAAILAAFPKAEIDEVTAAYEYDVNDVRVPVYWRVRFHVGKLERQIGGLSDGTLMRFPTPVEIKDLPKAVIDAVTQDGSQIIRADKVEKRTATRFVALMQPQVVGYTLDVVEGNRRARVSMTAKGKAVLVIYHAEEKEPEKGDKLDEKEIEIPAEQAKVAKATKGLFPDAVIKKIRETNFVFELPGDGTTYVGYEVTFVSKGVLHEIGVSQDGVVFRKVLDVEAKNLPKAVTDALVKELPEAKIKKAQAKEIHADTQQAPVEKPYVYYDVTYMSDGKMQTVSLSPEGRHFVIIP
jgi:hypothetical protein